MKRTLFLALLSMTLWRCANQTSPTGGPQDKTPPTLVSSSPENNERNFKGKSITLTFDEDVKLKDPKEEILITPAIGKKSTFIAKKRSIVITPENDWEENTTYSLSFREAVQDITEGNPADNLSLAFSTGPIIDSLYISGYVGYALKEQIPEKVTVALFASDTFDIFTHTPVYFTRTNKTGNFKLANLKGGTYTLYAFEDKNKNLKVDSKSEKFDFIPTPIKLDSSKEKLELALFSVDSRELKITNIRQAENISSIRFNKETKEISLKSERKKELLTTYAANQGELLLYKALELGDSIQVTISAVDSIDQKFDSTFYVKQTETKMVQDQFKVTLTTSSYDIEKNQAHLQFNFTRPLKSFTLDSCYIKVDSATHITLKPTDFKIDTLHHQIYLDHELPQPSKEPDDSKKKKLPPPSFYFGKGAFISIQNDSSAKITFAPTIKKEEETGTLAVEVITKEKNYIVQLLSENKIIDSVPNIKKHTFTLLEPATYKLQILLDTNQDGKWNPGNFNKKTPAEKIIIYKNKEKSTAIPIRANWEYGPVSIKF